MIEGSKVLITGGAGSVGGLLSKHFLEKDPEVLRIFDNSEPSLAEIDKELGDDPRCRFLAGDIRDRDRLDRAVEDVDVVVHTAAMKHVDISEYNPFEAVKTNVVGLQNVIDASIDSSVQRFIFTSSDKAVNPHNTMGTTKLLGEKLVTAANKHRGRKDIRFASVRFGNVINSSQSVVPVFREQIRNGGPITLTDPKMERFFLTYDEIIDLVTSTVETTEMGEIFMHKMQAMRIKDLAEAMIELLAPKYGRDPDKVEIDVTGRRPGETFHEETMTRDEVKRTVENDDLYAILPETGGNGGLEHHGGLDGFSEAENVVRSTEDARKLDREEIKELLKRGMDW